MKKDYSMLLLWQAFCVASTFWIPDIGWIYFLIGLALCYAVETILSQYAQKKGLQVFGTPFKGDKYLQDQSLLVVQLCFTILFWIVTLVLDSVYVLWNVFWLLLAAGIVLFLLFCIFFKQKQKGGKR